MSRVHLMQPAPITMEVTFVPAIRGLATGTFAQVYFLFLSIFMGEGVVSLLWSTRMATWNIAQQMFCNFVDTLFGQHMRCTNWAVHLIFLVIHVLMKSWKQMQQASYSIPLLMQSSKITIFKNTPLIFLDNNQFLAKTCVFETCDSLEY